jgi:hypothetical protein
MRAFLATLALATFLTVGAAGQAPQGAATGQVTDGSGGALPGVTVTATAQDGHVLATTVTDGSGNYALQVLPVGKAVLTFHLEGFSDATESMTINAGAEVKTVMRLDVAPLSETVVVQAPAPADARSEIEVVAPLASRLIPVPIHDRESVCGPARAGTAMESLGTIRSRGFESRSGLYTKGDDLALEGGIAEGLEVGRNVVVRRRYRVPGFGAAAVGEHTAGLLQVVSADEHSSIAVVVYACDELRKGDFLAAFAPEPVRTPDSPGVPMFDEAAKILFADEGQMIGAPRRLMVIDRGSNASLHPGQRVTLFRTEPEPIKRVVVGEAVVVAVRPDNATIRVERIKDVIFAGDHAAPQAPTVAHQR